jgi:membrane-bound metal-dependent hydrolase YbcI (DUF457 family)
MPSPVGHALGGLAVGLLVSSRADWRLLAACAAAAAVADADFLLPIRHRGASHSVGAAVIAGLATYAWMKLVAVHRNPARLGFALAAAYGTHVLFDWLGADSSVPRGLMALWPFSTSFFISDADLFNSVDRRYWLPGFGRRIAVALVREMAILGPLVAAAFWWNRRRRAPILG